MIHLQCPYCGATLQVPEEYKNDKRLHCSLCNQNFDNTYKPEAKKPSRRKNAKESQELSLTGKIATTIITL